MSKEQIALKLTEIWCEGNKNIKGSYIDDEIILEKYKYFLEELNKE